MINRGCDNGGSCSNCNSSVLGSIPILSNVKQTTLSHHTKPTNHMSMVAFLKSSIKFGLCLQVRLQTMINSFQIFELKLFEAKKEVVVLFCLVA